MMRRKMPVLRALAGGALLLSLAACEHYMPNSRPDRDSTEAITRAQSERLQAHGPARMMPPSQIRIPTGFRQAEDGECRDWLDTCWESGTGDAQASGQESVPSLARLSRPAKDQTFRGMLPCLEGTSECRGQHAILTLSEDRSWRARATPISQEGQPGSTSMLQGCWARDVQDPRHIRLFQANGNVLAELQATSSNNLVVSDQSEQSTSLRYTLTRQPDPDPAQGPAMNCAAP